MQGKLTRKFRLKFQLYEDQTAKGFEEGYFNYLRVEITSQFNHLLPNLLLQY